MVMECQNCGARATFPIPPNRKDGWNQERLEQIGVYDQCELAIVHRIMES